MMLQSKLVRRALLGAGLLLLVLQLVRPQTDNPPIRPANTVQAQLEVPAEVTSIFDRACADCHSNHTVWPWYSHVAPMGWLVSKHVVEGRRKMNLDDWSEDIVPTDICQEIRLGSMPMKSYLLLHPRAKLSGAEIQTLCQWSQRVSGR